MRTPPVRCQLARLPALRTRNQPDARGLLMEALAAHAEQNPGLAASVSEVVEQLERAGTVRHRDTIADWLQEEVGDDASPVRRVADGYYTVEPARPERPVVALGYTHRRVMDAARGLHASGRDSWTLLELVEALASTGQEVGRRRLHDVVVELREMGPPLVVRVARGRFRLLN